MIEIRGLTKRYGAALAVDGLSFDVLPGRVTGFLGPNGAGKSTTMRAIVGLDRPTAGSVTINGHAYTDDRAPLTEVGALLEARSVHPGRSAFNHLLFLAQSNGIGRRRVRGSSSSWASSRWRAAGRAPSPSAWASAWASRPRCSAIRARCSSTSR